MGRRKKESMEDVTGVHEISVRTIRSARASVTSLVAELKRIKEQVEEAVRTGDLNMRASHTADAVSDEKEEPDGGGSGS